LSKSSDREQAQNILYACIRDAQQIGDKLCTLAALKAVVNGWGIGDVAVRNTPSILRCIIRLLHAIRDEEDTERATCNSDYIEETCKAFETGTAFSKLAFRLG
jgi:hypothetical protein